MSREALDFLSGGAPTASFLTVGTTHEGKVRSYEKTQQRDMATGNPKVWEDTGEPMWQIVFTIETDERDPEIEGDDGVRRVFVKGNMLRAVRQALKVAGWGGKDPRDGILKVRYEGDDAPTRVGFAGPKMYRAKFTPPAIERAVDETPAPSVQRDPFADPDDVGSGFDPGAYEDLGNEPF